MSARRKYSDTFIARVKALWLMRLGDKLIASLVGAPQPTVRYIIRRYENIQPDMEFVAQFRAFIKGGL